MSHKRRHHEEPYPRPEPDHKRTAGAASTAGHHKRPSFPSYLDTPDLPPKIKLLCEILAKVPSPSVESSLADTGVRVTADDVEEVLKLSYGSPVTAVQFFRWAGGHFHDRHTPYAWNLTVDLLGKNLLFDAMWDAIKSMHSEKIVSLATFASVFGSYVAAGWTDEAIKTFEVMDQYGVVRDVAALNSLVSAICREGKTVNARDFVVRAKGKIQTDADTYAILLEGWENERDARGARETFGEMVMQIGWDPLNVPAYDSFLCTLIKSERGISEVLNYLSTMKEKRCFPGMKFFRTAIDELYKANDAQWAFTIWEMMAGRNGCFPDTSMYNTMIALQCYVNQIDNAQRLMDEMVLFGVFPNSKTYNVMLQFLLRVRKLKDAMAIFNEMVKNECLPTHENCTSAVRMFLDMDHTEMAVKIWKYMIDSGLNGLESTGNFLVTKLQDLDKLPEACKYAEDMAERDIKLRSATLSRLRNSLTKLGKGNIYDRILRKWKSHE